MATTMSRPALPPLDTPASATFPSELKTPLATSPTIQIKHEEPQKTPLTPPAAYLDFLAKRSSRNFSPPASATFSHSFIEKPALTSHPSTDSVATESSVDTIATISTDTESVASVATETGAPEEPPARTDSPESQSSADPIGSTDSGKTEAVKAESSKAAMARPSNPRAIARIDTSGAVTRPRRISAGPGSPFTAIPNSAHTPRRLCIPQSPYSPRVQTPLTATGAVGLVSPHPLLSPATSTLMSPATSTLMSPATGNSLLSPYSVTSPKDAFSPVGTIGAAQQMTLKHVVTRTVTIARPAAPIMEPVPASKKRRIEGPSPSERSLR